MGLGYNLLNTPTLRSAAYVARAGGTTTSASPTPIFNAKDYGVKADGVTDDAANFQAAMNAAAGVGRLMLPTGTILCKSALTFPNYLGLVGQGRGHTVIQRGAAVGDFVTSVGAGVTLESLTIDTNQATYGAGRGLLVPAGNHGQYFKNMESVNSQTSCLEFAANGGSGFTAVGCYFVTSGTPGSVGAVYVNGTDPDAVPRFFFGCSGVGSTLFNFGGANDFYAIGGFSNGLIFGSASSKVFINSMRLQAGAANITISGTSHKITGTIFAGTVTLDNTTASVVFESNEVPSGAITDNGAGNLVSIPNQSYTPTWTGTTTNPTLGNGTLTGEWSRRGNRISVDITLTIGSTTTLGSGTWEFTVPVAPYAFSSYKVGPAWLYASSGVFTAGVAQLNPALSAAYLWANGQSAQSGPSVGGPWGAGAQIQFHIEYQCA